MSFHPSSDVEVNKFDVDKVSRLASDAKFSSSDVFAGTAAVAFIVKSAAKVGQNFYNFGKLIS